MSRFPGNIIKLPNVTPTQSSAQGVWSLKDQLVYQRNNQWPFQRDPYFNYTTLLLQGNVPNTTGPQAMTQPLAYNSDASTNNFLVTPNGDVSPRPFSPYGGGAYSNFFDGATSTRLTLASSSDFAFGTGAYTIEAWVYIAAFSSSGNIVFDSGNASGSVALSMSSTGGVLINKGGTGAVLSTSSSVVSLNAWNHIAATRVSTSTNETRIFVNGVLLAIGTDNNNWTVTTDPSIGGVNAANYTINGYISNLSVLKGTAKYTSNFTPSTNPLPTNTANQVLLACAANRFIDTNTATSAKTITVTGTPRVTDNSPFVSTDFTTGAGYFDGGTDYLSIASTNTALPTGTQDYSVEAWVYWGTQVTSYPQIVSNPTTNGFQVYYDVSGGVLAVGVYNVRNVITYTIAQTALANQWTHIVVTRSGNTHRMFVNGVLRANGVDSISFASLTTQTIGSSGAANYFVGYMSDVRSVLGSIPTAYQTSSTTNGTTIFTPPATLLPVVSGTSLLTLQTRAASQNIGFIDSSPNEFIVTKNGNTTQGTFSPFSPTGWSNLFNGSNNGFTVPASSAFSFAGEFTWEGFVYLNAVPGSGASAFICSSRNTTASNSSFQFGIYNRPSVGTEVNVTLSIGSTDYGLGWAITTPTVGVWYHVAVVRNSSNTVSCYWDGTLKTLTQGSASAPGTINTPTVAVSVGYRGTPNNDLYLNGYISNLRMVASALYSGSSITIPTAPFSPTVANTRFLTCQSNRFAETAAGMVVTLTNTPSVQAFSPFAPATQSSPLVTGGSGYFDGTTDYLTVPSNTAWNIFNKTSATVEFWVNPNAYSADFDPISYYQDGSNFWIVQFAGGQANKPIKIYTLAAGSAVELGVNQSATTFNPTQWNHCAFVKNGSTWSIYINGSRVASNGSAPSFSISGTLYIGSRNTTTNPLAGYLSGVRITDTAVYTETTYVVPTAPPTAIPNTSLLLNFTGGGIVDATGRNVIETFGNAQIATSLTKWTGAGSISNNGASGTRLQVNSSSAPPQFNMGTGDYTVEFWINAGTPAAQQCILDFRNADVAGQGYALVFNTSRQLIMYYNVGNRITTSAISANVWTHVAVVRYNGVYTIYLDGSSSGGTYNNSDAVAPPANRPLIGSVSDGSQVFNGNLSNFRISRMARYTSNFNTNLPTGPFPIG